MEYRVKTEQVLPLCRCRCSRPGCDVKASWKVSVPKKSRHGGNPYLVQYMCREHKNRELEYEKARLTNREPGSSD